MSVFVFFRPNCGVVGTCVPADNYPLQAPSFLLPASVAPVFRSGLQGVSLLLCTIHSPYDADLCLIGAQATVSRVLPEEVWRGVLGYADPDEYYALTRHAAGVSREFYWLLKNSLTTFRVHRPVVPLCGLVWLHSRDTHFSRIKCVEGESWTQ